MKNQIPNWEYVQEILQGNRYAVLATEYDGQPHASLIAVTPAEGHLKLIFATYRNTRKYTNLIQNGKVAILFENRSIKDLNEPGISVLTAFGVAEEVVTGNSIKDIHAHLLRHPELETLLHSTDCALFKVKVEAYQVVLGIDDVNWWSLEE